MEIMVDKYVYDKAEEMVKGLNTDVEGIFAFASYRLIKRESPRAPMLCQIL